jgi:hypothetical protein
VTRPRGTLGRELYIALCDRVAAQAFPEDVTGSSWHPVCHPDAGDAFADRMRADELPPLDPHEALAASPPARRGPRRGVPDVDIAGKVAGHPRRSPPLARSQPAKNGEIVILLTIWAFLAGCPARQEDAPARLAP